MLRSVLAQDTGCNTASLHDFLVTLSCLEGKEFQVVTWVAGRKTRYFNLHAGSSFIKLVLRSILTFTTTTSWATTVFPWLHSGDAEGFVKVPDRGPSARIGRPGYWWQMSRFVQ